VGVAQLMRREPASHSGTSGRVVQLYPDSGWRPRPLPDFCFRVLSVSSLTLALRRIHAREQLGAYASFGDGPVAARID
jgi:hypothetical protein